MTLDAVMLWPYESAIVTISTPVPSMVGLKTATTEKVVPRSIPICLKFLVLLAFSLDPSTY